MVTPPLTGSTRLAARFSNNAGSPNPSWAHVDLPRYGSALYGIDTYFDGPDWQVASPGFNKMNMTPGYVDYRSNQTDFEYFDDNHLATVSFAYGGTTYVFSYKYDLAGRPETITFPSGTGIVLHFKTAGGAAGSGWDANGRLISMRYIKGGSTIQSFDYSYDNSGNRIGMVDISAAGTFTWAYGYDWLDRLISVSLNGSTTALYAYDNSDNRASLTVGTDVFTYQVDVADQLQSVKLNGSLFESFQHNADGCMVSRTLASTSDTTAYDWNDFNNLIGFALNGNKQEADYYETDGVRRLRSDGTRYTRVLAVYLWLTCHPLPWDLFLTFRGTCYSGSKKAATSSSTYMMGSVPSARWWILREPPWRRLRPMSMGCPIPLGSPGLRNCWRTPMWAGSV